MASGYGVGFKAATEFTRNRLLGHTRRDSGVFQSSRIPFVHFNLSFTAGHRFRSTRRTSYSFGNQPPKNFTPLYRDHARYLTPLRARSMTLINLQPRHRFAGGTRQNVPIGILDMGVVDSESIAQLLDCEDAFLDCCYSLFHVVPSFRLLQGFGKIVYRLLFFFKKILQFKQRGFCKLRYPFSSCVVHLTLPEKELSKVPPGPCRYSISDSFTLVKFFSQFIFSQYKAT